MSTKIKTSTDVLRAAKQLLKDVGWVKGRSIKHDTQGNPIGYCATGAVRAIGGGQFAPITIASFRRLNKVAGKKFYFNVVALNDHPHTSKKQILAVFDRAINSTKKKSKKGSK